MYSKTYIYFRITDCTEEIHKLTKQYYKILPDDQVIFHIENLVPRDEEDHTSDVLAELLVVLQEGLAAISDKSKKISLITSYDYSNIPSTSKAYFNKDKNLMAVMELTKSFNFMALYAEHQSQLMTSTLAAMVYFIPNTANFYRSKDEAFIAVANALGTK